MFLLDPLDRLLLLQGIDPGDPGRGAWWFTPGGGLDKGESHRDAAARELLEETGIEVVLDGDPVWERTTDFPLDGRDYRQHEFFYLARLDVLAEVVPTHWTELEHRSLHGSRWWTEDELRATTDVVYPEWLREGLGRLLG